MNLTPRNCIGCGRVFNGLKYCGKCKRAFKKQKRKDEREAKRSAKRSAENARLLKSSKKLPAKNRAKSKIIDALLRGEPASSLKAGPDPAFKPKTIRYESLESKLEKKKWEF